jgi:hypothetical protein
MKIIESYLLVLLFLSMAGCVRQDDQVIQKTSTSVPSSTITMKAFPSETTTLTPQSMALTPIPTVEKELLEDYIYDLMSNNEACPLPCWWGITPERSSVEEAVSFLNHFGVIVYVNDYYDDLGKSLIYSPKFELERITPDFNIGFVENGKELRSIFVVGENLNVSKNSWELWRNYTPAQILANYGVPTRVLLEAPGVSGIGNTGNTGYTLWLVYDDLGFIVRYDGIVRDLPIYHICPSLNTDSGQITRIHIYMQSPEDIWPLDKSDSKLVLSETDEYWAGTVKSIDEAAGISIDKFYQLFLQTEEPACFDSPHDIWPKK